MSADQAQRALGCFGLLLFAFGVVTGLVLAAAKAGCLL